jgi:hypothetical protein
VVACQQAYIMYIYNLQASEIKCPVPSDRTLNEYQPIDLNVLCQFIPGTMKDHISLYAQALRNVSHVVLFNGKKIIPQSADVYLLDQEEQPKNPMHHLTLVSNHLKDG